MSETADVIADPQANDMSGVADFALLQIVAQHGDAATAAKAELDRRGISTPALSAPSISEAKSQVAAARANVAGALATVQAHLAILDAAIATLHEATGGI